MTAPVLDRPVAPPPRRRRPLLLVLGIAVGGVVLVVVAALVVSLVASSRAVPSFPSLADDPDPSLHGTVAYLDESDCVRVVAAAGTPSREVLCLEDEPVKTSEELGKPLGPQLVWLPDGRLEVTMFRMTKEPGPAYEPGWQKVVDVRTGAVEDTPAAQVPSEANRDVQRALAVSPTSERVVWASDPPSGRIEVRLEGLSASRTLLEEQGPPNYTYGLLSAFWAPGYDWVVVDDGRILVVTTDDPPVTRVLVEPADSGFGGDGLARFAVSAEDLLTPSG